MKKFLTGLFFFGLSFVAYIILTYYAVLRSTQSTAGIAMIYAPIEAAIISLPFFFFGLCIHTIRAWCKNEDRKVNFKFVFNSGLALLIIIPYFVYLSQSVYLIYEVDKIQNMNTVEINSYFKKTWFPQNMYILGAVAMNENANAETLDYIVNQDNPDLYDKYWSIMPVMGKNTHGLAVMRLAATHKNLSQEALIKLSKSNNNYVLNSVLQNPNLPVEAIRELSKTDDYLIEWGLAANPKTPVDILEKLSKNENENTRGYVAFNSSTPPTLLAKMAEDTSVYIRGLVAQNKNSPKEVLLKLKNDPDENVRQYAEGTLNNLQ